MDKSEQQIDQVLADAGERQAVQRVMEQGGPANPGRRRFLGAAATAGLAPLLGGCDLAGLVAHGIKEAQKSDLYKDMIDSLGNTFGAKNRPPEYVDPEQVILRPISGPPTLSQSVHRNLSPDQQQNFERLMANTTGILAVFPTQGGYEVEYSQQGFIVQINEKPVQHVLVLNQHGLFRTLPDGRRQKSHGFFVARAINKNATELTQMLSSSSLSVTRDEGYIRPGSILEIPESDLALVPLGSMCNDEALRQFQAMLQSHRPFLQASRTPLTPGEIHAFMFDQAARGDTISEKVIDFIPGIVEQDSRDKARAALRKNQLPDDPTLYWVKVNGVDHGNSGTNFLRQLTPGSDPVVVGQVVYGTFQRDASGNLIPRGAALARDAAAIMQIVDKNRDRLNQILFRKDLSLCEFSLGEIRRPGARRR